MWKILQIYLILDFIHLLSYFWKTQLAPILKAFSEDSSSG